MSATKISGLAPTPSISNTDLMVVVRGSSNAYTTNNISVGNLATGIVGFLPYSNNSVGGTIKIGNNISINSTGYAYVSMTGPFANDIVANSNGVAIGSLYYDSTGAVKIRLT